MKMLNFVGNLNFFWKFYEILKFLEIFEICCHVLYTLSYI